MRQEYGGGEKGFRPQRTFSEVVKDKVFAPPSQQRCRRCLAIGAIPPPPHASGPTGADKEGPFPLAAGEYSGTGSPQGRSE